MPLRLCKLFVSLLVLLLVLVLVLLGILLVWLAQEPRDLTPWKTQAEHYINQRMPDDLSLSTQQVTAAWPNWGRYIELELHGFTLGAQQKKLLNLQRLHASVDILDVLAARWRLHSMEFNGWQGDITRLPEGQWRIRLGQQGQDIWPTIEKIMQSQQEDAGYLPVRSVIVSDVQLTLQDESHADAQQNAIPLLLKDGMMEWRQITHEQWEGWLSASVFRQAKDAKASPKELGLVSMKGSMPTRDSLTMRWLLESLQLGMLKPWLPDDWKPHARIKATASLACDSLLQRPEKEGWQLRRADCSIRADDARYTNPEWFPKPIELSRLRCSIRWQQDAASDVLDIQKCHLRVADQGKMILNIRTGMQPSLLSLTGTAHAEGVTSEEVLMLWPLPLATDVRDWIAQGVTAKQLSADLTLDLQNWNHQQQPPIPEEAIQLTLQAQDASVDYYEGYPAAQAQQVDMTLTGNRFTAQIANGHLANGLQAKDATVTIGPFLGDDLAVDVQGDVSGEAAAVMQVLSQEPVAIHTLLSTPIEQWKGQVKGNVHLHIPLLEETRNALAEKGFGGAEIEAKATYHNLSIPSMLDDKLSIEAAEGSLTLNNQQLDLSATGNVNHGGQVTVRYQQPFLGSNPKGTMTVETPQLNANALVPLGVPRFSQFEGPLAGKATLTLSDKQVSINANADVSQVALTIPELSIHRDASNGKAGATVQVDIHTDTGAIEIPRLTWQEPQLTLSASAKLTSATQHHWEIQQLLTQKQNVAGTAYLDTANRIYRAHIHGSKLDASYLWEHKADYLKSEGNQTPVLDVSLQLAQLILGEDRTAENLQANLQCTNAEGCTSAAIEMLPTGGSPVYVSLGQEGEQRILRARTENMGTLAAFLNITPTMRDGVMDMKAEWLHTPDGMVLKGVLFGTDYRLLDTPLLGKILSLASLTGIMELFSSKGVSFSKMQAPFHYAQGVLTLKDAKMHGSSVGMTASGTIDLQQQNMHLEGALVPSYTVNNVLSNVPILGNLLQGGEGKGLFAANYSMKGNLDDPSVMVNPLSLLTPGFLRGLFDIVDFDTPDKDVAQVDVPSAPASGKND